MNLQNKIKEVKNQLSERDEKMVKKFLLHYVCIFNDNCYNYFY